MSGSEMLFQNDVREEGWFMLHTGWPDYVIWKEDPFTVVFVEQKTRNYALKPEQLTMLRLLERLGLHVKVNCGGGMGDLLSVDEFLQGGIARFKPLGPQQVLNYRHEVKVMREAVSKMKPGDFGYEELWDKIHRREQMLPEERRILPQLEREQKSAEFWSPEAVTARAKRKLEEGEQKLKEMREKDGVKKGDTDV